MSNLEKFKKQMTIYKDYPKKGILFIDVLPLLRDSETFSELIEELSQHIHTPNLATPEARGFIFGAPLLLAKNGPKNFIAFRKNGKLPANEGDLLKVNIVKEYGDDSLYFRRSDLEHARPSNGAIELTVFDDILATGGTSEGMAKLLNTLTVNTPQGPLPVRVKEFVFLGELSELKGRERLEKIAPVISLISF